MTAVVVPGVAPSESPAPVGRTIRRTVVRLLALVVGMFLLPNLAVLGLHLLAQRNATNPSISLPIKNFAQVDDDLWRGAAPTKAGYQALASQGVTTVIDLRAEEDLAIDEALITRLGINRVHLPLRDGQSPTEDQVDRFLAAVQGSDGRAFVHCGAGVGRTGTMSAAYLVKTGQATSREALLRNLSVGPPSLEQLAFASGLDAIEGVERPSGLMVAISRTVDAPRRIWVNLRGSYK